MESTAQSRGKFGAGSLPDTGQEVSYHLSGLPQSLDRVRARRPLLVLDRGAVAAAGIEAELHALLSGCELVEFTGFAPNPKSEHVLAAANAMREHGADIVVAIGGGSCMDVAKVAAVASQAGEWMEAVTRGDTSDAAGGLPVVAIPTTSGTGSEATHFAAIYVDRRKVSVAHPAMRPQSVLLDARLHLAMPPRLAAETGLDALAQSLESLWAVGSTAESLVFAQAAAQLVSVSLRESVLRGSEAARRDMMLGAHLAGQAINLGKTTAAHALSYALTQGYGIAHGHAVALTLGHVGAMNHALDESDCLDPRGAEHVQAQVNSAARCLGSSPMELGPTVSHLLKELHLPGNLRDTGVPREDLPALAIAADPVRLGNNPRRLSHDLTLRILENAWDCG
ncbi:MAG: Phosphonoacetaldehyde reductase [Candidatus Hydrogenedentota bacterium]|jgi:alcohol dehydrogenase class IV